MDVSSSHFLRLQPPSLVMAPMPKTASRTLLKRIHASIPSRVISPKFSGGIGHMCIDPKALRSANLSIFDRKIPIIYQHFFPTQKNEIVLSRELNLGKIPKVIVTVRNIYDVAISSEDHQWNSLGPWWVDRGENIFFAPRDEGPSHSHIWNVIVSMKFFASWFIASQSGKWNVIFVDYNQIIDYPTETLERIFDFSGIAWLQKNKDVSMLVDNLNKGEGGRGRALPSFYRDIIRDFAKSFRGVDFSLLGIDH